MRRPAPLLALTSLLSGLLSAGCETFTPTLYRPQIDASLKLPCQPPAPLAEPATDNELGAFIIRQAKAFVDCRDRHAALVYRLDADMQK